MSVVLVIDDAQTDRDLLARVVSATGHRVVTGSDGKDAVALAKAHRPALIFLDVVMPGQDGFATCRALHKDPETASIPVVMVTSKATASDVFWGQKQGAQDHVGKPWDKAAIEAIIRKYCR